MLFLGRASNYKASDIIRHLCTFGTKKDSEKLRQYLASRYSVPPNKVTLYHNGRSALSVAIKTTTKPGSEVLINGFTCYAVYEAVKSAKCAPIFADIKQKTLHFDAQELQKQLKLHPGISTIIIQNSLGIPVDIVEIEKIAKKYHLTIIEDMAHSAGVKYSDGREVGTIGAAAAFSFGKGKSIDTISGGALILRSDTPSVKRPYYRPKLSDSLRDRWYPLFGAIIRGTYHLRLHKLFTGALLKIHFIERSADAKLSTKTRLTHWQAKLALRQFASLPSQGRKPLRKHYFVQNREIVLKKLRKQGFVFDEIWYDTPVSPERYYKKVNFPEEDCLNSVKITKSIINLPNDPYLKNSLKPALKIIEDYQKDVED